MLAPLRGLENVAEDVSVWGHAPQDFVDDLTQTLAIDAQLVKKKQDEATAKSNKYVQP